MEGTRRLSPFLLALLAPLATSPIRTVTLAVNETCNARTPRPQAVGLELGLMQERLAGVSVPFIANTGQTDDAVAYYAPTLAGTVFITRDGRIVYSLPGRSAGQVGMPKERPRAAASAGWSLTEAPVGATGAARPAAEKRAPTQVSYFLGNDSSSWRSGIATYEGVSLGQVWPAITVSLRARGRNVEKLFTVEPGGDPSLIRMRVAGARSLETDRTGGLIASTGPGDVRLTRPVAYQEQDGVRRPIPVAYEAHGDTYGFHLGGYDPELALVIDPLLQATYLGGSDSDRGFALAIHPTSGDVYVAGRTDSTNFPGTAGGAQVTSGGSTDVFVARLNAALTTLTQATYLGGSSGDVGFALAIHPTSGDVYVAGDTDSSDFPGTAGGAQTSNGGSGDAFVARLNAGLTTLTQSTYLGGGASDQGIVVAIHPTSGDVYVAGLTDSSDLPGTAGGAQAASGGGTDAFVARLDAALTTLTQSTYLGGSGNDFGFALAIHPTSGDVYMAGQTSSTNFPGTAGGAQAANGGGIDAFVARLNAGLTTLTQSTYLGGSGGEVARAIAIHPTSGDVYVAGSTGSSDFPGTAGGAQAANGGGGDDAFIARLNAALTTLTQSTYLGGSGIDEGLALAVHPTSGDVYVAGDTVSTNFPGTTGGAQAAYGGGSFDAFVARLTLDLASAAPPTNTPTITPTNTPTVTPTSAPANTPTTTPTGAQIQTVKIPALSPWGRSVLAFALALVALLLIMRKSV